MSYYVIIGQMANSTIDDEDQELDITWCARVFHTEPSARQFLAHLKTHSEKLYREWLVQPKDNSEQEHMAHRSFLKALACSDYRGSETIKDYPLNPIFYKICVSPHG